MNNSPELGGASPICIVDGFWATAGVFFWHDDRHFAMANQTRFRNGGWYPSKDQDKETRVSIDEAHNESRENGRGPERRTLRVRYVVERSSHVETTRRLIVDNGTADNETYEKLVATNIDTLLLATAVFVQAVESARNIFQ